MRWDDWNMLQQYGHAILAYSGGIDPWMSEAASLPWIYNANGSEYPTANAFYRYNSSTLPASQGAPLQLLLVHRGSLEAVPQGQVSSAPAVQVLQGAPGWRHPARFGLDRLLWRLARRLAVERDAAEVAALLQHPPDTDPSGHQFQATDVVIQIVKTTARALQRERS